jgi:uncharacterized membrane protein
MNTSTFENAVLMRQARESLKGKWKLAVVTFAIYILIIIVLGSFKDVGAIVSLLISGPFVVGVSLFALSISRNKEARLEQIFEGFKKFGRALAAYLLVFLFVILWFVLLIVPGIIAALSYSQTFFILADDQTIGARDAIKRSKKMMYGYKWKYVCLQFRFIGWGLLCIPTLGIGFLWLFPYMQVSMAKFYDAIKVPSPVN